MREQGARITAGELEDLIEQAARGFLRFDAGTDDALDAALEAVADDPTQANRQRVRDVPSAQGLLP